MSRPVCAIVGAGEGLGRSLAEKFASKGFDLALISRSEAHGIAAMDAARQVDSTRKVEFFPADATVPETIEDAFSEIGKRLGDPSVVIYNARGSFEACEPLDMTYEALEDTFRVEVLGAFAAARSVLPGMIARGRGSLFFSSATAAFRGSSRTPLYAIGKFGLRALSQSLAKTYGKAGVHVVHFRLDCDLDVPIMRELYGDRYDPALMANPSDVAEAYWLTYRQPRSAWSNEVELRPHTENWTY